MNTALYEAFYEAFVAEKNLWEGMRSTILSSDLYKVNIFGNPDRNSYVKWYLVKPEESILNQIEALEIEFNIDYPEDFKNWFGMYFTLDMDCGSIRLPECMPGEPVRHLRDYLKRGQKLIAKQMLPFAYYEDIGELCFDQRLGVSDPPIVYWEHELSPENPKAFSKPLFSSFDEMIASLIQQFQVNTEVRA